MTDARCMFCTAPETAHRFDIAKDSSIAPGHACGTCVGAAMEVVDATPDGVCPFCRADTNGKYYLHESGAPDGAHAHLWGSCRWALIAETETVTPRAGETA
jgi:hypothetical protein